MAVYEGVLQEFAGGEVVSSEGTGGFWTRRMGISRYHRTGVDVHAGWVRRDLLVGDTRIRNVALQPQHDRLLQEAVGEEIALSIAGPGADSGGGKTLMAIRTPRGITRPSRKVLLGAGISATLKHLLLSPVLLVMLAFVALVAGFINFYLGMAVLAAAVLIVIWFVVGPVVGTIRALRAAGALDKAPWTSAAHPA